MEKEAATSNLSEKRHKAQYRDAVNPALTGRFTVRINTATIQTIPIVIGPGCALPTAAMAFLGDKLNVTNTAQVAYLFRIDNSIGSLIIQFLVNVGETKTIDTATTVGLGGGQTFKLTCDQTSATGSLAIGLSRNTGSPPAPTPTSAPATPLPPGVTAPPTPPAATPQPGAPPTPLPNAPVVPVQPTSAPTAAVPGIATPRPAPQGPSAPASGSCLTFCTQTCSATKIASCDCSTTPPSVMCAAPGQTTTGAAAVTVPLPLLLLPLLSAALLWRE